MSDDLIVVFVLKDTETRKYLEPMGLGELGDDEGKYVAGITDGICAFLTVASDLTPVDIILVPDSDLESHSEQVALLGVQANLKKRVYVCFHEGSDGMIDAQKDALKTIFGAKLSDRFCVEHHDSGGVFEALQKLSASCGNKGNYEVALRDLTLLFSSNPVLEAKLELLHLCLTPSGAKLVATEEHCPAIIATHHIMKTDAGDGKSVSEIVEVLTRMNDPFDPAYIARLEEIRAALLDERERASTTPQIIAVSADQ